MDVPPRLNDDPTTDTLSPTTEVLTNDDSPPFFTYPYHPPYTYKYPYGASPNGSRATFCFLPSLVLLPYKVVLFHFVLLQV
jgi:hypothetical protein